MRGLADTEDLAIERFPGEAGHSEKPPVRRHEPTLRTLGRIKIVDRRHDVRAWIKSVHRTFCASEIGRSVQRVPNGDQSAGRPAWCVGFRYIGRGRAHCGPYACVAACFSLRITAGDDSDMV